MLRSRQEVMNISSLETQSKLECKSIVLLSRKMMKKDETIDLIFYSYIYMRTEQLFDWISI